MYRGIVRSTPHRAMQHCIERWDCIRQFYNSLIRGYVLADLAASFLHICSDGFQDADDDRHQQEWKDVVFSEFAVHIGADEVSQ